MALQGRTPQNCHHHHHPNHIKFLLALPNVLKAKEGLIILKAKALKIMVITIFLRAMSFRIKTDNQGGSRLRFDPSR